MASSGTKVDTKVDCTRAGQNVWLVKVPNYLADVWNKADSTGIVGNLEIPTNGVGNVSFRLADSLMKQGSFENVDIPPEHKLIMSDVHQTMGVFSETPIEDEDGNSEGHAHIALEGKVAKRTDCRPIQSAGYMLLKRKAIEKACRPERRAIQTAVVNSFKPVNAHQSDILEPEKKSKEDRKRVRRERDEVLHDIFNAFEKHQYYSLKDLVGITQQPVVHLKAILNDVCTYNLKNPHKNTYELKPEYRHYKEEVKNEEE
jgi:transcription initiation factor TFIIF subunit beta